jgi:hypothetical protein
MRFLVLIQEEEVQIKKGEVQFHLHLLHQILKEKKGVFQEEG